ncbi:DnaJ-domain-containing protein [Auriculariales sp. MPI-PUGE-AT-0066]|nr:DnaJ-domain-containing protein [Auriculariales sp. MPI-PUGE-AT-0066]
MAASIQLSFTPPALPADWAPTASTSKTISPLSTISLLPAGSAFSAHIRRVKNNVTFEEDDRLAEEQRRLETERLAAEHAAENDLGVGEEEESLTLLALDPKEWKSQDHYAVLGLSKFRFRATEEQIRVAHRKKVLKHHPDKKANSGDSNNDAFFKCIQKALEILTHPEKRRQYDSVDHYYVDMEDEVPGAAEAKKIEKKPELFFTLFGPIFEREARFSRKEPVPLLGGNDAPKEEVEGFYDFWYNFDSWRSFEYLDKEVNEGSESRDDKRYVEKKNKTERARRKKEDTARLRSIVDKSLGLDPRIARIKREEKAARDAKKKGKSGTSTPIADSQKKAEEERQKAEDEAKKKEEEKVGGITSTNRDHPRSLFS